MKSYPQNIPSEDLLGVTGTAGSGALTSFSEALAIPVIDTYSSDPVLPMDYLEAMKTGFFNKVPIMTGTILNDGAVDMLFSLPPDNEITEDFWNEKGAQLLRINPSFNTSEVTDEAKLQANIMKRFYVGKGNLSMKDSIFDWVNLFNDAIYLSPDQKVAELASMHVPVYNYR